MKILKYILLLILFFSIAIIVFILTQKGNYKIDKSIEIDIPHDIAYSFLSDSSSFSNWSAWKSDEARINQIKLTTNDSIQTNLIFLEENNESTLYFNKTNTGVLITWKLKGVLNFKSKILSLINGGINSYIGTKMDKSLENIKTYLTKELKYYSIKIDGIVTFQKTNFIQQLDTCSQTEFQKKSKLMLQNMMAFVNKNNIKTVGLPFIMYENSNSSNKKIIFSMCMPTTEEILTTPGSEISGAHIESFSAVKATWIGDYSHRDKSWDKIINFVKKNHYIEDFSKGKLIEIYKTSLPKVQKPSKWITEIYYPIKKKEDENSSEIRVEEKSNLNVINFSKDENK